MLYAKPCCAVDPIENEEDRKKVRPSPCEAHAELCSELGGRAGVGSVLFLLAQVFLAQRVFRAKLLSGNK